MTGEFISRRAFFLVKFFRPSLSSLAFCLANQPEFWAPTLSPHSRHKNRKGERKRRRKDKKSLKSGQKRRRGRRKGGKRKPSVSDFAAAGEGRGETGQKKERFKKPRVRNMPLSFHLPDPPRSLKLYGRTYGPRPLGAKNIRSRGEKRRGGGGREFHLGAVCVPARE